MSQPPVYGVGIAGFGFIGKVHLYGYLNIPLFYDPAPAKARLVGVCTSRPESAEKAREQGGFEFCNRRAVRNFLLHARRNIADDAAHEPGVAACIHDVRRVHFGEEFRAVALQQAYFEGVVFV